MDIFKIFRKRSGPKTSRLAGSFTSGFTPRHMIPRLDDGRPHYRNWVYACINARADDVANIRPILKKRDKAVENQSFIELLRKPNANITGFELLKGIQAITDLSGNAFLYSPRSSPGSTPVALYLLNPDSVRILTLDGNPLEVVAFEFRIRGKLITVPASEIVWHRNFDPTAPHPYPSVGKSVVSAAWDTIATDEEARSWNFSFLKNSARPDGILLVQGTMGEEAYARLKETWYGNHGGSGNAGKTAILEGGTDWKQVTMSAKDMDFLQQRNLSRDEILSIFRVPKSILGLTEDQSRANAETAEYIFAKRTIEPLMRHLAHTLTQIARMFDSALTVDFHSPVTADRATVISEYTQGVDKWLTRNEIRLREGLKPIDGGDALMATMGNIPIAEAGDELPSSDETKSLVRTFKVVKKKFELTKWRRWNAKSSAEIAKEYKDFAAEQKKRVIAKLKNQSKEFKERTATITPFDSKHELKASVSWVTPLMRKYVKEYGDLIASEFDAGFDVDSATVQAWIGNRAEQFAKWTTDTTNSEIQGTLRDGYEGGETLDELSGRIDDIYDGINDYRASMIANTETAAWGNFSITAASKQVGVEQLDYVVVDPCDVCASLVGAYDVDDAPAVPDDTHPNCMCTLVPVWKDGDDNSSDDDNSDDDN